MGLIIGSAFAYIKGRRDVARIRKQFHEARLASPEDAMDLVERERKEVLATTWWREWGFGWIVPFAPRFGWGLQTVFRFTALGAIAPLLPILLDYHWFLWFFSIGVAFLLGPLAAWYSGIIWNSQAMNRGFARAMGFMSLSGAAYFLITGLRIFGFGIAVSPIPLGDGAITALPPMAFTFANAVRFPWYFMIFHTVIMTGSMVTLFFATVVAPVVRLFVRKPISEERLIEQIEELEETEQDVEARILKTALKKYYADQQRVQEVEKKAKAAKRDPNKVTGRRRWFLAGRSELRQVSILPPGAISEGPLKGFLDYVNDRDVIAFGGRVRAAFAGDEKGADEIDALLRVRLDDRAHQVLREKENSLSWLKGLIDQHSGNQDSGELAKTEGLIASSMKDCHEAANQNIASENPGRRIAAAVIKGKLGNGNESETTPDLEGSETE